MSRSLTSSSFNQSVMIWYCSDADISLSTPNPYACFSIIKQTECIVAKWMPMSPYFFSNLSFISSADAFVNVITSTLFPSTPDSTISFALSTTTVVLPDPGHDMTMTGPCMVCIASSCFLLKPILNVVSFLYFFSTFLICKKT